MSSCTVIIPAYNEAAVIKKTLHCLLEGLEKTQAEILVICNGCSDNTAELARQIDDPRISVIEIPVGSKTQALNEGDYHATSFPRIYLDADVRLGGKDICTLVNHLGQSCLPAAAPMVRMDFSQVPWVVRSYYRYWLSLPYVKQGMVGCGVYVLSEAGRSRFDIFPDVIADDGFVRSHFTDTERPVLIDCEAIVTPPKTLRGLLKIKTRSRLGGRQLRQLYPGLVQAELSNPRWRVLLSCIATPRLWLDMPVYLLVVTVSLWRSKRQLRRGQVDLWERDETSRIHTMNEVSH